MQVATIDESRWQAREKYAEYLRAVKKRHTKEYEALKNAYRELSRGKQVIDVNQTIKQAGVDNRSRPRLAIVRADARLCWYSSRPWRRPYPTFSMVNEFNHRRPGPRRVELPTDCLPGFRRNSRGNLDPILCRAVVPTIPPSLLPDGRLDRFHILWEADWEDIPVDPMLLKSLGKGLYVVLAKWDLTPLERAVLGASQVQPVR